MDKAHAPEGLDLLRRGDRRAHGLDWLGLDDFGTAGGYLTLTGAGNGTLTKLGINTAADTTNRLALKSNAALFSHDDVTPGTMRIVLNKSAAGKDAAFNFQDAFSTRSLFGLLGHQGLAGRLDVQDCGRDRQEQRSRRN